MVISMFEKSCLYGTIVMIGICFVTCGFFLKSIWMAIEKKKYFFYSIFFQLLIVLSGYGCMVVSNHYSVDSFNLVYDMSPFWHMQLGRYLNCGVILIALKFGVNQVLMQRLFFVLWIITLVLMLVMIATGIAKCMRKIDACRFIIIMMAVSLSFLNVFTMEFMLFSEMAMVCTAGNLALGLAVYIPLSGENTWKQWTACLLFLLIAMGNYQSYVGVFEAFVLTGLFLRWRDERAVRYRQSFVALCIGGGASVFNILLVKVMLKMNLIADAGRGASFDIDIIVENLKKLLQYQIRFWVNADGILPKGVMPVLAMILLGLIFLCVKRMKCVEQGMFFSGILLGCYILAFAPHIIEKIQVLTPRSNIAVWSVTAVVFISAVEILGGSKKVYENICAGVLVILLGVNSLIMQDMAANEQANNALDMMEAHRIAEKIWKYENETGNIITKVATVNDDDMIYYPVGSRYHTGELGGRIMATHYSNYRLIGYVLNRNMERVDMPEEIYQNNFLGKDWDYLLVDEQVVCEGDTAYIAIY